MNQSTENMISATLPYKECPGTRQPTVRRFRIKPTARTGDYGDRYGYGYCSVCGKVISCHKDKTAVRHKQVQR